MQSRIHSFISSLEVSLSSVFPAADVSFDGQNLSIHFRRSESNGDFVLLLVDLTCMEEEDAGSVAVHARPDHIFEPHWVVEEEEAAGNHSSSSSRTLILPGQRFVDGFFDDADEYEDGHGNSMWMFTFPQDEGRISDLIAALAGISAGYFFNNNNNSPMQTSE